MEAPEGPSRNINLSRKIAEVCTKKEPYKRQKRDEKEKKLEMGGNKNPHRRNNDDLKRISSRRIL